MMEADVKDEARVRHGEQGARPYARLNDCKKEQRDAQGEAAQMRLKAAADESTCRSRPTWRRGRKA